MRVYERTDSDKSRATSPFVMRMNSEMDTFADMRVEEFLPIFSVM